MHAWGVAVAMQAAQTAYQLLLFHVLAPDLLEAVVQATLDTLDERLSVFAEALPDSAAFRKQMEEALREGFSRSGLLLAGMWGVLFAAVGAAVVALIFRRKPANEFD